MRRDNNLQPLLLCKPAEVSPYPKRRDGGPSADQNEPIEWMGGRRMCGLGWGTPRAQRQVLELGFAVPPTLEEWLEDERYYAEQHREMGIPYEPRQWLYGGEGPSEEALRKAVGAGTQPSPRVKKTVQPPRWLESRYRPRRLSENGRQFLDRLAPNAGLVSPVSFTRMASLSERREYLARRYVALDLLRKGLVIETFGHYQNARIPRPTVDRLDPLKEGLPRDTEGVEAAEILWRLAVYRRISWDQLMALDPSGAGTTVDQFLWLTREKLVTGEPAKLGCEELTTLALTERGWAEVQRVWPEAVELGYGPRKPLMQNREYHEQAVGDAIAYFEHEIQLQGGILLDLRLDKALRREGSGLLHLPDLRFRFQEPAGVIQTLDVEVVGVGVGYGRQNRDAKTSGGNVRLYDPSGRTKGDHHVSIGR